MSFAVAQVFYIDPLIVKNSPTASIDVVDLYFKSKPQANNNKSGISSPGVQVFLVGTANTVPALPTQISLARWSRVEWADVNISSDATLKTTFRFDPPVPMPTDSSAAIVVRFDGNEDYVLWKDTGGEQLVGTTTKISGPTAPNIGGYFTFLSDIPTASTSNNTSNSNMVAIGTTDTTALASANTTYAASAWKALSSTALKFNVYVARYSVNGNFNLSTFTNNNSPSIAQIQNAIVTSNTANGEIQFLLPQDRYEYLAYDRINSSIQNVSPGERIFPVLPFYPPGSANLVTLNCVSGSNTITATGNVNWNSLLNITSGQPENLIITSQNALGANADIVNVRAVTNILSNTVIQIDQPMNFTNAVAVFYRAPVATVDQFKRARFFGSDQDVVICKGSSANVLQRFSGHSVNSITIALGGTGYTNTDWVKVTGHTFLANKTLAPHNANANILTNTSGGITAVYLANVGAGFANIANVSYIVANSSGATSTGTGANLTISIGTNLKGEFLGFNGKGGNFANSRPITIEVGQTFPGLIVHNPAGTYYNATIRFPYYTVDDATVFGGRATFCDVDNAWDTLNIMTFTAHQPFEFSKRRALPSWSNELFTPYANGTSCAGAGGSPSNNVVLVPTSNASVITITTVSNNDFAAVTVVPTASKVTYSRYIVNNDYTNENTNYGNSWAKGIEVKFNLANNALAEDLLVYAQVYQPANTQILAFAKIYNTHDNDSFDTKDWTMLQLRAGNNIVSSPTNFEDTYELTWGFQQYPNVAFQLAGSITTTNGSKTITGSNTTFSSNLVSGDMVLIQNNLFPNLYQIAIANVVTNATSMTINTPVSNLNLVGTGFIMSKIAFKYQAFNNNLNDNVARYYSSTLGENDGFNAAAIKLVMLSANGLIVPMVADLRAVAVSA